MTTMVKQIDCPTPESTQALGQLLGSLLFPGAVVALVGPLGAGKTLFTRGIALGLGINNPSQVTSPTFVLIQEYAARLPIYHFDVYRLKKLSEFEDLGALEYFAGNGVCLVEWANKVTPLLPPEHLQVSFDLVSPSSRQLTFTAHGKRYQQIVDQISCSSLS